MVAITDLTSVRPSETGDQLFYDSNNNVYILKDGDTSNTPILITDFGNAAYGLYSDYSSSDYISTRKVYAVEETNFTNSEGNTVSGYALAIVNQYGTTGNLDTSYELVYLDSSGQIDWNTSTYSTSETAIMNVEQEFNEDLNGDGVTGFDSSLLTQKTSDVTGDLLLVDSAGSIYIKPVSGELISVVDPYNGQSISLDRSDSWAEGSSSSETLKVTRWDNDTASDLTDDKYLVLVKDSYTYSGTTNENFVIYKVDLDGKIDWMSDYNPSLSSYEADFNEDLNGDSTIGVNAANIAFLTTDVASPVNTPSNARLKRDSVDKTLYIDDGGTLLNIVDEFGTSPSLEYESIWDGGSYSSVAYAVEKKSDGTYCLAIKNTDSGMAGSMWNIYSLTLSGTNAVISYNDSAWTQSISGYEISFGQDMNGDGSIGVDTSSLTSITTDTTGNQLKKDADGAIYITDSSGNNPLAIKDPYGGAPSLEWESSWTEGSYKSEVIAVTLIDDTVDYYNLAVKNTNTYGSDTTVDWQIYKISLEGEIDWMSSVYTTSIVTWEGPAKFNQDLNMDGDSSGTISVSDYGSDTDGVTLGKADGMLFLRDDGTDIGINDGWIEGSQDWGEGSWSATAIAADKHSDGYYQLAVKQTNSYTDYWNNGVYSSSGTQVNTVDWQVYAIDTSGNVLWDKTTWTQSIGSFEVSFNQDLDGDGTIGLDMSTITVANTDTFGWTLRKDASKNLYVTDSDGNNLVTLGDDYGTLTFDYEYNWGSGSSKSEAIAAEKNSNGSFSVVVKNSGTDSWDGNSNSWSDYQLLQFSSAGVIDWESSYTWTQDIKPYESIFGQDIDGDGAIGLDLNSLITAGKDSFGDTLKKDSTGNSFYIVDDKGTLSTSDDVVLSITEDWGGSAQLEYSSSWEGGSWKQEAIAVESLTYTNRNGTSVDGFVIAIKNTSEYGGENWSDWELKYTNDKGVIDWEMSTWTTSIKKSESLFGAGQDLDGDGISGLSTTGLTDISTDTSGVSLKKDSENSLYIIDGADIILITDEWGGTTSFDYEYSGGSATDAFSYSSSAYAVEDFTDSNSNKNYLLAIKNIDTFGSSSQESWQTYTIKEKNVGSGDWYLDWMSSSWSKGISKKESIFGQDLNGNGTIEDGSSIATTKISTDTSDGGITGAQLCVDSEGSLYIVKGTKKIAIVDDSDNSVNFDWQYSWGDFSNKSESYAVEGIDSNSDDVIDSYKLAIKHTETDSSTGIEVIQWETINIAATGIVDWTSFTWGDSDIHEQDLNQDLDGDGEIWSTDKLTLSSITTDSVGATAFLDERNNAYVQAEGSTSKSAILDESGNLISFSNSWSYGDYSTESSLYGVSEVNVGGTDYYKLLIKHADTNSGTTTNFWETVNVLKSTNKIDWSTANWYDDPKKLESVFNTELDGVEGIYTINSSNTTPVGTDITGAQLRQSTDGSLFIKDGETTITVTSPDGGYVDFDYAETFTSGSFDTKAIAAQKVGNDYKIVVKETTTITGSESIDTFYTVYKLSSTGVLNWGDITYRTAEELNETEFGQDIDGDGTISSGSATSASDTYADFVSTGTTDAETLSAIQNTAQSDIFSITNADNNSSDKDIEMYVEGIEGTAKGNYGVDIKVVQTANDSLLAKAAADTGLSTSDFNALTGVMDFSVTIADPDNYGKIVSMSWVLPGDTENPKYFKKDVISGEYFDFVYDQSSGEGAQWDPDTRILKVSVRDNGKYDSNNTLGIVKDPGFISSGKDTTNPILNLTFPVDNSKAVPNNANFELTFSEKVDVKTGNIVIKKRSDDSLVETIDVTSSLVTGSGTNKITINPSADLALNTEYYVQIDATAFDDKAGNSYSGISDKTSFTFKTSANDLAPLLISATPADDASSASHLSNIALSFSEAVKVGSGNVVIYRKTDDVVIEKIDITSSLVSGSGTNIITINPNADLQSGTEYYVQIDSTALVDSGDNAYAGISDKVSLSFTTSPYLFTSTSSDQVIANTGKAYAQSSSNLTIGSLTYKIYSFDGEISAGKYYNVRSVYSASINEASLENVTLNSRALDFQLTTKSIESTVVFDTDLVTDSLSITDSSNKRDTTKFWTYYSINDSGTIEALHYDPIKNAGAKFFDTSGDGIADTIHLELIDGGYGDKDGLVNGIIKDPSTAGTTSLDPDFLKVNETTLSVVDTNKKATPATVVLNAALDLDTRTNSVDEIGYVVLNEGESTLTIDQFKARARILFNSLENSDVTLTSTVNDLYSQELYVANNQNLKLFKVSDGSISDLTSLTDTKLSYFAIENHTDDLTLMKTSDGMSLTLTTTSLDPGINELIGNLQYNAPVLDFASVPNKLGSIAGTLEYAREANYDSVIGFYRVVDSRGGVIDSITGNVVTPSDANYKDFALASSNLVTELADISIDDNQTASKNITIEENSIIAPYAVSNGETWFAYESANPDGISHFKTFGTNSFGFEDLNGGGDKDFDDFIVKFDFNSVNV